MTGFNANDGISDAVQTGSLCAINGGKHAKEVPNEIIAADEKKFIRS